MPRLLGRPHLQPPFPQPSTTVGSEGGMAFFDLTLPRCPRSTTPGPCGSQLAEGRDIGYACYKCIRTGTVVHQGVVQNVKIHDETQYKTIFQIFVAISTK